MSTERSSMQGGSNSSYRPDIDGLRAVAVLLVLFNHLGLGVPGGYVGVDVFFVISGFLITGIIVKEQQDHRFRLTTFWARRIRRIFPAAFVLVFTTLLAGLFLMLPEDLEMLAKSAIAQQLMSSNIFFWKNIGYFSAPAERMPLLHTWSLGAEEQFYLGFPFLLVFCNRLIPWTKLFVLLAIAITSFAISLWGVAHHPSAAFFLLPPRAWELLVGSLLFLCPPPSLRAQLANEICGYGGLAAILLSGCFYDSKTIFPGASALVPCLGAAALIHVNSSHRTTIARLMSNRLLVGTGVISYSLYLWHWPLIAFSRYWFENDFSLMARVAVFFLSFAFAYLSWRFVENPFRYRWNKMSFPATLCSGICSGLILVSFSVWIVNAGGLPGRIPTYAKVLLDDNRVSAHLDSGLTKLRSDNVPKLGRVENGDQVDMLLWGDSHAMAVANLVDSLGKEYGVSGLIVAAHARVPLIGVRVNEDTNEAYDYNDEVMELIRKRKIRFVIIAAIWQPYTLEGTLIKRGSASHEKLPESTTEIMRSGLKTTFDELKKLDVKIWVMYQVPTQDIGLAKIALAKSLFTGIKPPKGRTLESYVKSNHDFHLIMTSINAGDHRCSILDPSGYVFGEDGYSQWFGPDGLYYQDNNHVSSLGADRFLRPMFTPVFESIRRLKDEQP